ncbi:SKP1-like protein 5 [Setaria viridis]|uniref:SKP1-like protein 5 n=1 Tax=Setaria viridis TaxID=4556 RepID=UPI003B3A0707
MITLISFDNTRFEVLEAAVLLSVINDLVRDRSVEEVRWVLGIIDNGFTVEEEEEIRRENAWAFE